MGGQGVHKVRRRSQFGELRGRWGIIQVIGNFEQVKIVVKIPQESMCRVLKLGFLLFLLFFIF